MLPFPWEDCMRYRVTVEAEVLVDVEVGGAPAALRLARTHVCNDWLLRTREGTAADALHFVIKGLSAEAKSAIPFEGNKRVEIEQKEEEADIW
jgi:hypothetical protein